MPAWCRPMILTTDVRSVAVSTMAILQKRCTREYWVLLYLRLRLAPNIPKEPCDAGHEIGHQGHRNRSCCPPRERCGALGPLLRGPAWIRGRSRATAPGILA